MLSADVLFFYLFADVSSSSVSRLLQNCVFRYIINYNIIL